MLTSSLRDNRGNRILLRITQSVSAGAVEQYFREALNAGEYYGQKGESAGFWGGISAADLGLVGEVNKKAFRNLANGLHPTSGQQLTARLDEDRRPGYDFTFSVPGSGGRPRVGKYPASAMKW